MKYTMNYGINLTVCIQPAFSEDKEALHQFYSAKEGIYWLKYSQP